jgi:hypothetical protein
MSPCSFSSHDLKAVNAMLMLQAVQLNPGEWRSKTGSRGQLWDSPRAVVLITHTACHIGAVRDTVTRVGQDIISIWPLAVYHAQYEGCVEGSGCLFIWSLLIKASRVACAWLPGRGGATVGLLSNATGDSEPVI